MAREDIRKLARELGIPFLIHFTRVSNLESTMRHGLRPRERFPEVCITPEINDRYRLDGYLGATSLSIAFPNYRMFYRLRQENPAVEWVVLAIDPRVLWEKDCAFCRHNAADARISSQPLSALRKIQAFEGMFDEIEGADCRIAQGLKTFDPTDGQAEVLVFDVIEPERIRGAVFGNAAVRDAQIQILEGRQVLVHPPNRGYFASRSYVRTPKRQ
jgi:hypothetical protein